MRIAEIKQLDITNGDGIRVSVFCTGCEHYCEDCFNKKLWSFDEGEEFNGDVLMRILEYVGKDVIDGISLLGGEPLHPLNITSMLEIIKAVKEAYPNKDVWIWTGYTYEQLCDMYDIKEILKNVDYLIDGKYDKAKRNIKLKYRGSENQRVIDVKETLKNDLVITKKGV